MIALRRHLRAAAQARRRGRGRAGRAGAAGSSPARAGAGDAGGAACSRRSCCSADIWNSAQLQRRAPPSAGGAGRRRCVALAVLGAAAAGLARRPALIGPLAVLALPFRVPIQAGSEDLEPAGAAVPGGRGRDAGVDRAGAARRLAPAPGTRLRGAARRVRRLVGVGRAAAGAVRGAVRDPGRLLAGLPDGAAADGVLLRPVHAAVSPVARSALDAAADPPLPAADRGPGGDLLGDRLRRVRDQDDHPQPQAGRGQRPAHLLHRQLGVLRPRHLRPLPGADDGAAGGDPDLRAPAARAADGHRWCWRCCGRGCC